MRKRLFIPGPVEIKEDVLEKMASPMIGHRSKEASDLQRNISEKLMKLMNTEEQILLSTTSGSGLMEAAIRSCTRKKAAVFSVGAFGNRWYDMALANNVAADKFTVEWGQVISAQMVDDALASGEYDLITITHNETSTGVTNPLEEIAQVMKKYPDVVYCLDAVSSLGGIKIEVDKMGVDICIASTQKALGLPPGLAVCSFSKKAIEAAKEVEHRGMYLDLLNIYDYTQKRDHQYPSTPSLSHMFALDYQLDKMLEEGFHKRYDRHTELGKIVRTWAKKNFDLFCQEEFSSNTVTAVKNTKEIDVALLNKELGKKGYVISNGYGKLKDKTFRIGHMADTSLDEIKDLLKTIDGILEL